MTRQLALTVLGLATIGLAGCMDTDGPDVPEHAPTFPVTGIVHIDGQPTAGVRVSLFSGEQQGNILYDRNLGSGHQGTTDAQGKFQITSYVLNDGAPAGSYFVVFYWPGKAPPAGIDLIPDEPHIDREAQKFNMKYADPNTTKFEKITVTDGQPLDMGTIELTTKK